MDERLKKLTLSISETAEVLGVSRPVVYQLTHRADFPAFKIGSRTVVSVSKLREWVERQADHSGEGGEL